jgi:hypothetical protein
MKNQPDLLSILLILAIATGFTYNAYRAWFDLEKLRTEWIKGTEKASSSWPFRNFALSIFPTKFWPWWVRIGSTLGALLCWLAFIVMAIQIVFD